MKISIPTGIGKKYDHNFHTTHVTTYNIGDMRPIAVCPVIQGDKNRVDLRQFSRIDPTVVPTFGSFQFKVYSFFVPHRVVWRGYEGFIRNASDNSVLLGRPTFYISDIFRLLTGNQSNGVPATNRFMTWKFLPHYTGDDVDGEYIEIGNDSIPAQGITYIDERVQPDPIVINYDWFFGGFLDRASGNGVHLGTLTADGRMLINTLRSLGYVVPSVWYQPDSNNPTDLFNKVCTEYDARIGLLDMLPLLAYARALYDFIFPSLYVDQQGFGYLFQQDYRSFTTPTRLSFLESVINLMFVPYQDDFFNTSWALPNQMATTGRASEISPRTTAPLNGFLNAGGVGPTFADDTDMGIVDSNSQETAAIRYGDENGLTKQLNPFALRTIQWMQDFILRNNIGGSRFHEYMKSHFGFVTKEQDSDRSTFIKSSTMDFDLFSVTNLAEGASLLGEQAGQGRSEGHLNFTFTSPEEGFLVFITALQPLTGYYQGLAPWTKVLNGRFDFYTPARDKIGFEPIPVRELFLDYRSRRGMEKDSSQAVNNAIFGPVPFDNLDTPFCFNSIYADKYKRSYDILSGDFIFDSRNEGLDSYHTYRDVTFGRTDERPLSLDSNFFHVDNQYNRIFAVTGDESNDHVQSIFRLDIRKNSLLLSIKDSLPFFDKSGREANVRVGGASM